jgi:hypothetical protein
VHNVLSLCNWRPKTIAFCGNICASARGVITSVCKEKQVSLPSACDISSKRAVPPGFTEYKKRYRGSGKRVFIQHIAEYSYKQKSWSVRSQEPARPNALVFSRTLQDVISRWRARVQDLFVPSFPNVPEKTGGSSMPDCQMWVGVSTPRRCQRVAGSQQCLKRTTSADLFPQLHSFRTQRRWLSLWRRGCREYTAGLNIVSMVDDFARRYLRLLLSTTLHTNGKL